jgi:hypothetical protein
MLFLVPFVMIFARLMSAQVEPGASVTVGPVTITEPRTYGLADLYNEADTVVLAKVLSGDAEAYSISIYKAVVIETFKGAEVGQLFYFGPYRGLKLGMEYVLFLRRIRKPLSAKTISKKGYGTINYREIFNQGYSQMATSYECVFDGEEIDQRCADAVRVCTDYVKLPKAVPAFPPEENDPPFGCRWVKEHSFIALLDSLAKSKK